MIALFVIRLPEGKLALKNIIFQLTLIFLILINYIFTKKLNKQQN